MRLAAAQAGRKANPLKQDPTRTAGLRRAFIAELRRRFARLKGAVVKLLVGEDALGLRPAAPFVPTANTRWRFATSADKLVQFKAWLKTQVQSTLTGQSDEQLWKRYAEDGFRRGAGRAFDDVRRSELAKRRPDLVGPEAQQSLSDFYAGTKDEFLRSAFGRPVATEKIELLASRSFDELENVTEDMGNRMGRVLADGLVTGASPHEIARDMTEQIDISRQRAELISRTELIRAHAQGTLYAMEQMGVEEVGVAVEFLGTDDDRICPDCQALQGIVLKLEEAQNLIPVHPNCVTGESVVTADDVLAVLKTHYSGEVIELATANGRRLAVTPNHMLLTEYGFLPVRFAYRGLKVLDATAFDAAVNAPDDDAHKAGIADVFAALAEDPSMFSVRVPASAKHLHGDGAACHSEIHVVRTHGVLGNKRECANFPESTLPAFQFGGVKAGLSTLSPVAKLLGRAAFAADSSMGRCRDTLALLLGHALYTQPLSFSAAPGVETGIRKALVDGLAAAPESVGESLRAHPVLKHAYHFIGGQVQPVFDWDSVLILPRLYVDADGAELAGDGVLGHAESFRQLAGSLAGAVEFNQLDVSTQSPVGGGFAGSRVSPCLQVNAGLLEAGGDRRLVNPVAGRDGDGGLPRVVKLDEIIDVQVKHVFNLPVYDVQTQSTLYRVNGLVTSNCRCAFIPANVGEDEKGQKRDKADIDDALAEADVDPADVDVDADRPESILGNAALREFSRLLANAEWDESQHPRDEHGRWATVSAALVAAHPHPGQVPPLVPGTGRPDLRAKDPALAEADRRWGEYAGAQNRWRTADTVRRLLSEKAPKPIPVPPADAPRKTKGARALRAVEEVRAADADVTFLGPAFASHQAAVAASHPDAPAALEAARGEARRRYEEAVRVAEAHVAGLPEELRGKAAAALGRVKGTTQNAGLSEFSQLLANEGWVTLEDGQHVYIGEGGEFMPHGPGEKIEKPSSTPVDKPSGQSTIVDRGAGGRPPQQEGPRMSSSEYRGHRVSASKGGDKWYPRVRTPDGQVTRSSMHSKGYKTEALALREARKIVDAVTGA